MNGCFYCCKDCRKTDSFIWPELFLKNLSESCISFPQEWGNNLALSGWRAGASRWKGIKPWLTHTDTVSRGRGRQWGEFSTVTKLTYTKSSRSNFTVWQCVFWWHTEHTYNIQSPSSRFERDEKDFCPSKNRWEISTLCTSLYHCCHTNAKKKEKSTARSLRRANPLF